MTIPPAAKFEPLRARTPRDRFAWAFSAIALCALLCSLLAIFSIGLYIGLGAVPLFLLGAWLSPSRGRRSLAILGVGWGVFCLALLVVALTY